MSLRDYLSARREEIEAQIKALRSELNEIKIAEAALSGDGERVAMTILPGGNAIRPGSIKDWVIKALTAYPDGLDTEALIEAVRKMHGPIFLRSSTTPQLSRLKSAGLIRQDGRLWRLSTEEEREATKLYLELVGPLPQNDETPDEYQSSGASEEEAV